MTALEAHLKLVASLPSRIHRWEPGAPHKQGRPNAEQTRRLNAAILRLMRKGLTRKEIAEELGVATVTVGRHLRGEHKIARA